jgi:hypothetical protein
MCAVELAKHYILSTVISSLLIQIPLPSPMILGEIPCSWTKRSEIDALWKRQNNIQLFKKIEAFCM